MRRGGYALLGLVALAGMGAAAWLLVVPHLRRETLTIVSLLPRQGSAKPQTDAIVQGIRLALEEHDRRAGRFKLRHDDWDYSVSAGSLNSMEAKADYRISAASLRYDVPAVIGAYDNATSLRILLHQRGLEDPFLVISPASTRSELTEHDSRGPATFPATGPATFFRTIPARPVQGWLAARWAVRQGMKRVHVYHDDRDHDPELPVAFRDEARQCGLAVTESAEAYPSEMARLQARARPDLIYMTGNDPEVAADVIGFLRLAGYEGKVLLGSGSLEPTLLKEPGKIPEVYVTDSTAPPPPDFQRRTGTTDPYAYYGYLAAKAAIEAIAKADSKDRAEVIRACAKLPMFDPLGEIAQPALGLYRIANGRFEPVEVLR